MPQMRAYAHKKYRYDMQKINLGARLSAVAALITGDFVADVGTDHGFLPIYLAESGKIRRAVASDIRPEPLSKARENIAKHALSGKIETVLTDGLVGLEKYPLTDIVIAGMGGLTIIDILENADFVKTRPVHLIIQPMQHVPETRKYLCENGYVIDREVLASDDGKIYQIISAKYGGKSRELSPTEATLGAYNIAHKGEYPELFISLCEKYISVLKAKTDGYAIAGIDAAQETDLMHKIEKEKMAAEEKWQP